MAQAFRHVVEFDVIFQHHRGVGMTEGVEAAVVKLFFAPHVKVAHVVASHGSAVLTGTDEVVFPIVAAIETAIPYLLLLMTDEGLV